MEISQSRVGGVAILAPSGRIDSFTARTFEGEVMAAVAGGAPLVIDFANLAYISSAGLRVLLMAMKQMRASGGRAGADQPATQRARGLRHQRLFRNLRDPRDGR